MISFPMRTVSGEKAGQVSAGTAGSSSAATSNANSASGSSSGQASSTNSSSSLSSTTAAAEKGSQQLLCDNDDEEVNSMQYFRRLLHKGEGLALQTKEEGLLREAIAVAEYSAARMTAIATSCMQRSLHLQKALSALREVVSSWRSCASPFADAEELMFRQHMRDALTSTDWASLGLFSVPAQTQSPLLSLERPHLAHSAFEVEMLIVKHFHALNGHADGTGTLSFPSHRAGSRPTLADAREVLSSARLNPLKLAEISYISAVHSVGEAINGRAAYFLAKAKQARNSSSSARIKGQGSFLLEQMHLFLKTMNEFPLVLPCASELDAFLLTVENWKLQVRNLGAGSSGATAKSAGAKRGSAASKPSKEDSSGTSQMVPLRVVESLLLEGEKFPFDMKEELESLREKKQQAKLWLDRLKKSFTSVKVGTNRLRNYVPSQAAAPPSDEGNLLQQVIYNQNDRLTLAEMKQLLSEGETLYQQQVGDSQASVPLESLSSSAAKFVARSRDLDRAQSVVDNAEDWISRVREVLTGQDSAEPMDEVAAPAEDETVAAGNEAGGKNIEEEQDGGGDGDSSGGGGKSEERSGLSLRTLAMLLDEANSMPVALEEAQALRYHLQAIQWATKLPSNLLTAFRTQRSRSFAEDATDSAAERESPPKIKYSELQAAAKEISK